MFLDYSLRCLASLALTATMTTASFAGDETLQKTPGAQVFTLTPALGPFTEPGVAINPGNPQQVVGVFQDNVHAAYSQDAGRTRQLAVGVDPKNYRVSGDVSVTFDNQGHAFICY